MRIESYEHRATSYRRTARMKGAILCVSAGVLLLLLNGFAMAQDVSTLQELGKHIFFDNISTNNWLSMFIKAKRIRF